MSRFKLLIKAYLFRTLAYLFSLLDRYISTPLPRRSSFTRIIPSTSPHAPGSIKLFFYTPKSYSLRQSRRITSSSKGYPVLINFHGGGFTIGRATDDARWASSVLERGTPLQEAVVISVEYRLAPVFPFPIAIEDCVAAIRWIWAHAEELGIDISRTAISGFSAGGNLSLVVPMALHSELKMVETEDGQQRNAVEQDMAQSGGDGKGTLVGIVSFYPSTNWTQTRAERDASNNNIILPIPPTLFRLFDESYLYPLPKDMSDPMLSPGLASDKLLHKALPANIVLMTCSGDQLLAEGEEFRDRLKSIGKTVEGYAIKRVGHAWDKRPTFWKGDKQRDLAYDFAAEVLHRIWAHED